eukprot:3207950-Pyramimonas_sp.AAC.1
MTALMCACIPKGVASSPHEGGGADAVVRLLLESAEGDKRKSALQQTVDRNGESALVVRPPVPPRPSLRIRTTSTPASDTSLWVVSTQTFGHMAALRLPQRAGGGGATASGGGRGGASEKQRRQGIRPLPSCNRSAP